MIDKDGNMVRRVALPDGISYDQVSQVFKLLGLSPSDGTELAINTSKVVVTLGVTGGDLTRKYVVNGPQHRFGPA